MHMRPKKIIVCLGLPVKKVRWHDKEILFMFCIGYIGHADVPTLTVLVEKN